MDLVNKRMGKGGIASEEVIPTIRSTSVSHSDLRDEVETYKVSIASMICGPVRMFFHNHLNRISHYSVLDDSLSHFSPCLLDYITQSTTLRKITNFTYPLSQTRKQFIR